MARRDAARWIGLTLFALFTVAGCKPELINSNRSSSSSSTNGGADGDGTANTAPTYSTSIQTAGKVTQGTTLEDTALTISHAQLLSSTEATDAQSDKIKFVVTALGVGTLTISGNAVTVGSALAADQSFVWTPVLNANGNDVAVVSVKASDALEANSTAIRILANVTPVDDAPVASLATATATEDSSGNTVTLTYTDVESDVATGCAVSSVTGGAAGACTCTSGQCTFTFTPTVDLDGTGVGSFNYTITANGATSAAKATSVDITNYCLAYAQTNTPPYSSDFTPASDGTVGKPYRLCTKAQIVNVQSNTALWDKYFKLKKDIDLGAADGVAPWSGVSTDDALAAYTAIIGTAGTKFTGTFDGGGYKIDRFACTNANGCSSAAATYVGFLGWIQGDGGTDGSGDGEVKNLWVTTSTVEAGSYVGLVAGRSQGRVVNVQTSGTVNCLGATCDWSGGAIGASITTGLITGAVSSATINNGRNYTGGIVGYISGTSVTTSTFTGTIVGAANAAQVGGIVGQSDSAITNCVASGSVTGNYAVGGLVGNGAGVYGGRATNTVVGATYTGGVVGIAGGPPGIYADSYATGTVTASNQGTGGYAGAVGGGATVQFTRVYATGKVTQTAAQTATGGLVGLAQTNTTISNSYATGDVTSAGARVGGLVGDALNTFVTQDSYAAGNVYTALTVAGGLVGQTQAATCTITRSFALGSVTSAGGGGNTYAGGLIGFASGPVTDSFAMGNVTSNGGCNGGFMGYNSATGTTTRCFATGAVRTLTGGGGLHGCTVADIIDSYATGSVTATGVNYVGGLVGWVNGGALTRVYATGNVSAPAAARVGGLLGYNNNSVITHAYATGDISGSSIVGGLVGENVAGTYTGTFFKSDAPNNTLQDQGDDGNVPAANIDGRSAANLRAAATFTAQSWDFYPGGASKQWVMPKEVDDAAGTTGNSNGGFPRLTMTAATPGLGVTTKYLCYSSALTASPYAGTGTASDPYIVCDRSQLTALGAAAAAQDKYIIVGENIDLAALTGTAFNRFGSSTAFSGSFDGMGYQIRNFTYSSAGTSNVGLFSSVSTVGANRGDVRNLVLTTPTVVGGAGTGAAIGSLDAGRAIRVSVVGGSINGGQGTGGVIGVATSGAQMRALTATSAVTGSSSQVGGAVGANAGTLELSFAKTGPVSGATWVGGLVGQNTGTVQDSYAQGAVNGTNSVGGLIGDNLGGTVARVYSTGVVTGTTTGGLVGSATGGTVTDSHWDVQTSLIGADGSGTSSAGGTGRSTANAKATGTFTNWDFNLRWIAPAGADYPRLKSE